MNNGMFSIPICIEIVCILNTSDSSLVVHPVIAVIIAGVDAGVMEALVCLDDKLRRGSLFLKQGNIRFLHRLFKLDLFLISNHAYLQDVGED